MERTSEAEIRLEEQISDKAESCRENSWNEIQLKGPQRQKQTQEQNKKEWASSVGLYEKHRLQNPHHVKVRPWGHHCRKYMQADAITKTVQQRHQQN